MPYTMNNLPSYIMNKSEPIKMKWMQIFNSVFDKEGEHTAFIVANKWLKSKLSTKEFQSKTINGKSIEVIKLSQNTTEFISKSENGEEYIEFTLTDIYKDKQGDSYPPELLQKWASEINTEGIVGDIDHAEFDRLISSGLSEEDIKIMLKNKPSIAKSIKALFKDGVLKVRAVIDKRYKKLIGAARGVSLEALVTRDSKKNIVD